MHVSLLMSKFLKNIDMFCVHVDAIDIYSCHVEKIEKYKHELATAHSI